MAFFLVSLLNILTQNCNMKLVSKTHKLNASTTILPVVGKVTFDHQGIIEIEDEQLALEVIEATKGSIDLINLEAPKEDDKKEDVNLNLTYEEQFELMKEKILNSNLKELKGLAAEIVRSHDGIKFNDWNNLKKEDLQKFLLNLITPSEPEADESKKEEDVEEKQSEASTEEQK